MKKTISILCTGLLLMACSSDDKPSEAFNFDATVLVSLKDAKGGDLLDSNHENAINIDDIRVFHVIDGFPVMYYDSNMDAPYGFILREPSPPYTTYYNIGFLLNTEESERPVTTTIIHWGGDWSDDTVVAEIESGDGYLMAAKVFYNGIEVVYQPTEYGDLPFVVIKE